MMGTKKRSTVLNSPSAPAQMKFRSGQEVTRGTAKGTKPLPGPTTVSEILTKVVVFGCKKILFLAPKYRLMGYAVLLFFASLVADYMPFPKTYFAYSDNIPNQYFVKFSWAWTLCLVGIFVFLTSSVYCGGDAKKMLRHFSRLLVGTVVWFTWTNIFRIIEESTGQCITPESVLYSVKGRRVCASKGGKWTSFDISGHAFLLIWCVLFITEECRAIVGWDSIKDFIRHEDHNRRRSSMSGLSSTATDLFSDTPLSALSVEEFDKVRRTYNQYATLANIQLVFLTALVLLWDGMLIATAVYFHVMLEKVIGGLIAAAMWFAVYRCFYTWDIALSPGLPGSGLFRYSMDRGFKSTVASSGARSAAATASSPNIRSTATNKAREPDVPLFMGMPIGNPLRSKAKVDTSSPLDST